jgi:hypothetical protein
MYHGTISYVDGKERLLKCSSCVLTILFEILLCTERRDSILSRFFASWWSGEFLELNFGHVLFHFYVYLSDRIGCNALW